MSNSHSFFSRLPLNIGTKKPNPLNSMDFSRFVSHPLLNTSQHANTISNLNKPLSLSLDYIPRDSIRFLTTRWQVNPFFTKLTFFIFMAYWIKWHQNAKNTGEAQPCTWSAWAVPLHLSLTSSSSQKIRTGAIFSHFGVHLFCSSIRWGQ